MRNVGICDDEGYIDADDCCDKWEAKARALPDEELVKEIMWINKNFGGSPNAKLKIRKLLQSRKPRIMKDQIKYLVLDIQNCRGSLGKPCVLCIDTVAGVFKSKGFEVVEKP